MLLSHFRTFVPIVPKFPGICQVNYDRENKDVDEEGNREKVEEHGVVVIHLQRVDFLLHEGVVSLLERGVLVEGRTQPEWDPD